MILAEDELAIGTDHAGIMVLDDDGLAPGTPLERRAADRDRRARARDHPQPARLPRRSTASRARSTPPPARRCAPPPWARRPGTAGDARGRSAITVECPDLCPRFTARVFEDVKIGPSPPWLKARLMAAGQRPISNVVDITNYVMLLTGQPLHAFDLDRVAGAQLTVRRAARRRAGRDARRPDADARLRDGADRRRRRADVDRRRDGRRPLRGRATRTTRVLMEAANWNGANIHRTSLKLGLRSEASARFEKQLQPEQAMEAQAVATQLMIELCGATRAPGHDRRRRRRARRRRRSALRDARDREPARRADPARALRARSSSALEFDAADADDGLDVTRARVPPRRRHPRGRPDRGGRAARRPREAARDAALAATAPPGGSPTRQRLRRARRRRADRPGAARDRRLELRRARAGEPPAARGPAGRSSSRTRCRPSSRSCARRCSARCSTSRSATARAAPATMRLFEAGAGVPARRRRGSCPTSPTTSARCSIGAVRPPTWREPAAARRPTSSPPRACSPGCSTRSASPWSVEPSRAEPFLHPGRAASDRRSAASRPAGSARSTRWSPPSGTSARPSRRSSSTSTPSPRMPSTRRSTRTSRASPRSARTSR